MLTIPSCPVGATSILNPFNYKQRHVIEMTYLRATTGTILIAAAPKQIIQYAS
jgi:hypothetical protein